MNTNNNHHNLIKTRFFTAFVSLLLSLQAVYFDDIINRDGILYMQMAEVYLTGGLHAIQGLYDWPAFAILIAWVHQLTSLSIETSGLVLNSLFFILLTDALILISSLLVATPRQLTIAAVLILCFTPLNEYRDFILRDPGYWAFSSLALYQFMLFIKSPNYKTATLWQVFMVIAILFRIEGSVILLALPLFLLFSRKPSEGLKQIIQASYLLIITLAAIVAFVLSQPDLMAAFGKLSSISSYLDLSAYTNTLSQYADVIKHQILNQYSEGYAAFILISGMLAMFTYKILKAFSVSYLIVYFATASKTLQPHAKQLQQLLLYFFALNILILITFLFKHYFISSRYTLMALISLLLIVMHSLSHGIERLWLGKNKVLLSVIAFALFYSVADTSTQSIRKTYIKDAAVWAAHNLPDDSLVMTDDSFILHYFDAEKTAASLCVKQLYKQSSFLARYADRMPYTSGPCADIRSDSYLYFDYIIVVEKRRNTGLKDFLKTLNITMIHHTGKENKNGASVYKVIQP
jgi:hypothetical protein